MSLEKSFVSKIQKYQQKEAAEEEKQAITFSLPQNNETKSSSLIILGHVHSGLEWTPHKKHGTFLKPIQTAIMLKEHCKRY